MLIGLLIGLAVNFRLPNLFLASGYLLFFLGSFLLSRNREALLQGMAFGAALTLGVVPTLLANAINAGSPFSTTYGGVDAVPPGFNASVLRAYFGDLQLVLLIVAGVWTALILRLRQRGERQVALVVAGNLVVNLIFFMTHPIFTPYYTIPVAMLALWSLLFATLIPRRDAVGDSLAVPQPVKA
jgi:hypothetical protein